MLAHVWPIRVAQIAVWELAALVVMATVRSGRPLGIAMIVLGAGAFALSSWRIRGLCGYEWILTQARFRRRRRARRRVGPVPLALRAVLPDLDIRTHVDRAGNRAGVAGVGDTWTSVVRVTPSPRLDPTVLVWALRAAFERRDIPLTSAQLVVWTVPGVAATGGTPEGAAPVRVHWLAVRYRPADAPLATRARGGGVTGAVRTTATAAFVLARDLAEAGYPSTVLDGPELHQQLLVALGVDPAGLTRGPDAPTSYRVDETWRSWAIGSTVQACYRPLRAAESLALLGQFAPGAAFTCASLTLRHDLRGAVRTDVTLRIGAAGGGPGALQRLADSLAVRTVRADGRHEQFVRQSLPLGL